MQKVERWKRHQTFSRMLMKKGSPVPDPGPVPGPPISIERA